MRWVILDTETNGLDPNQGHRVIEIGAIEVVNRLVTGKDFHTYLNPDRDSDFGALNVHGLSTEFLSDKPRFESKVDELLAFVDGAELIIHNAPFDLKFLNSELSRLGRPPIIEFCSGVTDSLLHARSLHPGKRNSLDSLCDRYGVSNAHRTLHGALLDARLLAEVWLAMTRGQDSLAIDEFSHLETSSVTVLGQGASDQVVKLLAEVPVTAAEQAAHETYLDTLDGLVKGTCAWRKPGGAAV